MGISMFSCAIKPVTLVLTSLDGIYKPEVEIHKTGGSNNYRRRGDIPT